MEQTTYLKINPADSVIVCLEAKKKGAIVEMPQRAPTSLNTVILLVMRRKT